MQYNKKTKSMKRIITLMLGMVAFSNIVAQEQVLTEELNEVVNSLFALRDNDTQKSKDASFVEDPSSFCYSSGSREHAICKIKRLGAKSCVFKHVTDNDTLTYMYYSIRLKKNRHLNIDKLTNKSYIKLCYEVNHDKYYFPLQYDSAMTAKYEQACGIVNKPQDDVVTVSGAFRWNHSIDDLMNTIKNMEVKLFDKYEFALYYDDDFYISISSFSLLMFVGEEASSENMETFMARWHLKFMTKEELDALFAEWDDVY